MSTANVLTQNQTFDGMEFKSIDDTFMANFMFTVNASDLTINFKNCVIDVKGQFFKSAMPVALSFDNCQFKVLNTTILVELDYSSGTGNGCSSGTNPGAGDLNVMNSIFTEASTNWAQNPTNKSLFRVSSLFGVNFSNL